MSFKQKKIKCVVSMFKAKGITGHDLPFVVLMVGASVVVSGNKYGWSC